MDRVSVVCFFFFQAEDGIRDDLVTGVQTCALPIYWLDKEEVADLAVPQKGDGCYGPNVWHAPPFEKLSLGWYRSEKRRVGERGRSRGAPYHLKKKRKRTLRPRPQNENKTVETVS